MANTMQFDLVSPERKLISGEATSVMIPGAEGDMVAMPDHAPAITTLRPGILSVEMADGTQDFVVTGGFAEISAEGTSILAEEAMPKAEATAEMIAERIAAVESAGGDADTVAKRVADLQAVSAAL